MQICQLSTVEAEKVKHFGCVPDCRLHTHISQGDAQLLSESGKVRFISRRAVVAVSPVSLSTYWYDRAVKTEGRYLGTAQSGTVRTTQLVNFMPRGMKHRVRDIEACGAHGRLMTAKTVNEAPRVSATNDRIGAQE
jgi:hypothetical protein